MSDRRRRKMEKQLEKGMMDNPRAKYESFERFKREQANEQRLDELQADIDMRKEARRLGITPAQLQELKFDRLKAQAEAGSWGKALLSGGYSPRGVRQGRPSGAMTGGYAGLGTIGQNQLDMWGRPALAGRGITARAFGTGTMDMFGRQKGPSSDYGIAPMDAWGNLIVSPEGRRVRPDVPMWLPSGSSTGFHPSEWFRFGGQQAQGQPVMQPQQGDYLSGFSFGGAGSMGGYNNGGLQGFNLANVGLGGGMGGFALRGGLGMGGNIGIGDSYSPGGENQFDSLGDGGDIFAQVGKLKTGLRRW
jgi:hypothetical protein